MAAMAERPRRVLVVDDDGAIRRMLSLALAEAGWQVVASDGRHLTDADLDVDAVLLDVRLGGRTAEDLLAEAPRLRAAALIVMTASDELPASLARLGDVAVLRKPFDLITLDETLARELARRH